jgi:hypothetical protein
VLFFGLVWLASYLISPSTTHHLENVKFAVLGIGCAVVAFCGLDDDEMSWQVYSNSKCTCSAKDSDLARFELGLNCAAV